MHKCVQGGLHCKRQYLFFEENRSIFHSVILEHIHAGKP